jgi:hypothetical protein
VWWVLEVLLTAVVFPPVPQWAFAIYVTALSVQHLSLWTHTNHKEPQGHLIYVCVCVLRLVNRCLCACMHACVCVCIFYEIFLTLSSFLPESWGFFSQVFVAHLSRSLISYVSVWKQLHLSKLFAKNASGKKGPILNTQRYCEIYSILLSVCTIAMAVNAMPSIAVMFLDAIWTLIPNITFITWVNFSYLIWVLFPLQSFRFYLLSYWLEKLPYPGWRTGVSFVIYLWASLHTLCVSGECLIFHSLQVKMWICPKFQREPFAYSDHMPYMLI